ncbi:pyrroline-5-carboxylate reductase [Candidatus Pantoea edessiphila]|uniref:Pyrroline-5-carboxylate reductase n=1 Tax=Candidatus Pantoea edessiphila TaxID=2044610 RepID=A0A2P5T1E9_9GAMM|nr:pyrroline-5-carboxylate reductase [Candidatus Pantoea edessiphila]PPI88383.1 pyrroline-5-carboxylate reductase [Candidatus Pantoea edessiphila]
MKKKIGFIGIGTIAKAIIEGLLKSKHILSSNIWIYDHKLNINKELSTKYNINYSESDKYLIQEIDILFLTTKPNIILKVLQNIAENVNKEKIIVSVAAGITINKIESVIGSDNKIVRVMPNIASLVCEGMTSITPNKSLNKTEINLIVSIFESIGKTVIINENLIHSVIGISSSAPAYVFMFIEAMADSAVLSGMTYPEAYKLAAQALKGSAQMLLEIKKHPGELKNMVCSPGGTTIEAIKILEEKKFRSAIIEAVQQCIKKSKKLS